eukprot:TRINITY_DN21595_c0_g2_i1.p1 TRINITY_DN21595_c0_g2~~TRINITY_DN21595_c0_g2_i1.p1  ORF type:complete len:152 (-),score=21.17 TRINITY_DN21595_c0_g2_i1:88-543(-)
MSEPQVKKQKVECNGRDISEITNVLNKCMLAMDNGDEDEFASCFVEDGMLEIVLTKTETKDLRNVCKTIKQKFPTAQHWEGNVYVQFQDNEHATNVSYWKAIDGGEIVSQGKHFDKLVKVDGVWKMQQRKIVHVWTKAAGHIQQTDPKPKD